MAEKYTGKDFNKDARERTAAYEQNLKYLDEELNSISNIFNFRLKMTREEEKLNNLISIRNEKQDIYLSALKDGKKIHGNTKNNIEKTIKSHDKEIKVLEKKLKIQKTITNAGTSFFKLFDNDFLMSSDKAIRSINTELGLSNYNATLLRDNFYKTAGIAARMGATVEDLANLQGTFSDETGRSRALTSQMLSDITSIAKGTGVGIENASRLAGQFELMGIHGTSVLDYAQGIVDTSERMGVNTTKVLKKISSNFKSLQNYTFRGGVMAMAKMAQHAEKFHYDMGSMLDSAEKARTLEGAVKLAAELQVMGGEFAKTNPFEILFLSRNDPDKYAQKINNMTKGIATFRKNSEGIFETFISPVDIDRLEKVGQSLGMQRGELTQQARRMAEIQKMRQQMMGAGYTNEQMKILEGMSKFDSSTGRFTVQIGQHAKDISNLTKNELQLFEVRTKALKDRALDAQTFDEAFKATLNELKSALLPMLSGVNYILGAIRPTLSTIGDVVNKFTNSDATFNKSLLFGAGVLFTAVKMLKFVSTNLFAGIKEISAKKIREFGGGGISSVTSKSKGKSSISGKYAGKAGLGKGLASAGMGAGVAIAAVGISQLAESMAKLDKTQIWALPVTIIALAGAFLALSPAITAIGVAATAGSVGLLAVGGSIALVGAGIGVAALGIGKMSSGLSELVNTSKGADWGLAKVAAGLLAINAAMAMGGITALLGGGGLLVLKGTLNSIAKNSDSLNKVGDAFKNISTVMNGDIGGLKKLEETINKLSSLNLDKNSAINKLSNAFNKPIKVEFSDKEISLVTNITANIDGETVAKKMMPYLNKISFNSKFKGHK